MEASASGASDALRSSERRQNNFLVARLIEQCFCRSFSGCVGQSANKACREEVGG
jgi:hypothetical protein